MPDMVSTCLGSPPYLAALGQWVLGLLLPLAAWHVHPLAPMPGLLLVGLSPFAAMYFFFRGFNLWVRQIAYTRTRRKAHALRLAPDWSSRAGGFLLADSQQGLWVGDGADGSLDALQRLVCRTTGQAHRLELFEKTEKPVAAIGMDSPQAVETAAYWFQHTVNTRTGRLLVLDIVDDRD